MTKQKILFTPGPLNTSMDTKKAMLTDLGTRDIEFSSLVQGITKKLLNLAHANSNDYTCVLLQGSGTYGVESVVTSTIKEKESLLILANGAYGERMAQITQKANVPFEIISFDMIKSLPLAEVEAAIKKSDATHVAFIHNETTAGVLNDLSGIVSIAHKFNKKIIVDAMSSFGTIPINLSELDIDYLITSSNKCLHGVPGVAIIFAKKTSLSQCENICKSLSLDLYDQNKLMETSGAFRFTAPTHVLLALDNAIDETINTGGINTRFEEYTKRNQLVRTIMQAEGFETLVEVNMQAPMITTFLIPNNFKFANYYDFMKSHDMLLYSGKLQSYDAFRIGNMGEMQIKDIERLGELTHLYRKEQGLCK